MQISFTAVAAIALVCAGAASADTETFDFNDFTRIDVSAGLEVVVRSGDTFAVTAEGSARALKRLDIEQHGDTLNLSQSSKGLERFSPLLNIMSHSAQVTITLPLIAGVNAGSGSDVQVDGVYAAAFSGQASSGAGLELSGLDATTVALEVSSGADIDAAGSCGHLVAVASSGADLDARNLVCDSADAQASSGANIDLSAAQVKAEASSGADIDAYGAEAIEAGESSGGSVQRHD